MKMAKASMSAAAVLFSIVLQVPLLGADANKIPSHYERSLSLDGEGCAGVEWTVDSEAAEITFSWKSTIPDVEWIALGLSESGGMKGADIVTIRKLTNGGFAIDDLISTATSKPERDYLQNYNLLQAGEDDEGRLFAVVRRSLKTCDKQDIDIVPEGQYLICASGFLQNGDIGYHGNYRSTALVNLMVDQESLFDADYSLDINHSISEVVAPGVTARAATNSSGSVFPVDLQLTSIALKEEAVASTHYMCQLFDIPFDMRFVGFEKVWSHGSPNNETFTGGSNMPDYLHHIGLFRCPYEDVLTQEQLSGEPFDCLTKMPDCESVVSAARGTGLTTLPPKVHFPLKGGVLHMVLVHYEVPPAALIQNDFPGMRLWIEPPQLETKTHAGQIAMHDALLSSIEIPADPKEQELTLQFQISADFTSEMLPEGGVQVFGSAVHMHEQGLRMRAELIRDGVHILNILDTIGFDFDRQVASWKKWSFLPGDAIVVSCIYQAQANRTITGGFRSSDEMCELILGWTPEVPMYGRPTGIMVRENEDFMPTYNDPLNTAGNHANLKLSDFQFAPNPAKRDYEPLQSHRLNVCEILLADTVSEPEISFGEPGVFMQYIMIAFIFFCFIMSHPVVAIKLGIADLVLREKRNSIVYIGEILYSTLALPFIVIVIKKIFPDESSYDAYDIDQFQIARGLTCGQSVIYLLEMLYRIKPNITLVLHHIITAFIVIFLNYVIVYTKAYEMAMSYGMVLILFAMTEQPMYVVLLLKNLGFREKYPRAWPKLCYTAAGCFLACRVVIVTLLVILIVRGFDGESSAWQVQKVSFSGWTESYGMSNVTVSVIVCLGLLGLMISNFTVLTALHRMAKKKSNDMTAGEKTASSSVHDQQIGVECALRRSQHAMMVPVDQRDNESTNEEAEADEVSM